MKRHPSRVVTRGFTKLASATNKGQTQEFWYYMWVGSKWHLVDIRALAKASNHDLPKLAADKELEGCRVSMLGYEMLLARDLERVAIWCDAIDAKQYLGRVAHATIH